MKNHGEHKTYVICSLHFKDCDIDKTGLLTIRLKKEATPYVRVKSIGVVKSRDTEITKETVTESNHEEPDADFTTNLTEHNNRTIKENTSISSKLMPVEDGTRVKWEIKSEPAMEHVEGGCYIGPEFLLGQVYDGSDHLISQSPLVLYRPVYVCITNEKKIQNH